MGKRYLVGVLVIGVALLGVAASFVGCGEDWLEDEVVPMIEEELTKHLRSLDELTVSTLFIADDDGKVVAPLGVGDDGSAMLTLGNETHIAVSLGNVDGGGGLLINNSDGKLVASLASGSDGNGTLLLFSADGNTTFRAP